jgi:hypothetical protein
VEIYTGSTSTRSIRSYIQGVPVPDQQWAIYREYQYQINEVWGIWGRYVHDGRVNENR